MKMGKKSQKNISYILQFIDSARFMASLSSNHVNNLSEGMKNVKLVELNISIVTVFLNMQNLKYGLIEYKCFCCNKIYNI